MEGVDCSTRAELKWGVKILIYPHPQKERNHTQARRGFLLPLPLVKRSQPSVFLKQCSGTLSRCQAGHFCHLCISPCWHSSCMWRSSGYSSPESDFKWAAPTPTSQQLPGRPQTMTLAQLPSALWLPEGCHTANATATAVSPSSPPSSSSLMAPGYQPSQTISKSWRKQNPFWAVNINPNAK